MIKVGDKIPSATVRQVTAEGAQEVSTDEFFKGKKVALFAVPGAFTSTCSAKHLPSFVNNTAALRARGIDAVACTAVNDASVLRAWSREGSADGKVTMLADGNGDFARKLGLELDATGFGMGRRAARFAMIVDNGVVKQFNLEEPGGFGVSSGDHLLNQV